MYRAEFGTSGGTNIRERGPYNTIPFYNYLSGTGKSHAYRGPGYYVPSENRWMAFHEYRSLPRETKRDAILFESEDDWVTFQRKRDSEHPPSGISMSGVPTQYTGVPVPTLLPSQSSAWSRRWTGSGYYLPSGNKWFRDQDSPGIPRESMLFINEEDWIKFKYASDNPVIPK